MRTIVKDLLNNRPLEKKHLDHDLSGKYGGVRECHIEPDWLLIYDKEGSANAGALKLIRTGTHRDLF